MSGTLFLYLLYTNNLNALAVAPILFFIILLLFIQHISDLIQQVLTREFKTVYDKPEVWILVIPAPPLNIQRETGDKFIKKLRIMPLDHLHNL